MLTTRCRLQRSLAWATAAGAYLYSALKVKEKNERNAAVTARSIIAQLHQRRGHGEIRDDGQSSAKCSLMWPEKRWGPLEPGQAVPVLPGVSFSLCLRAARGLGSWGWAGDRVWE